jgi:hypothetical protein
MTDQLQQIFICLTADSEPPPPHLTQYKQSCAPLSPDYRTSYQRKVQRWPPHSPQGGWKEQERWRREGEGREGDGKEGERREGEKRERTEEGREGEKRESTEEGREGERRGGREQRRGGKGRGEEGEDGEGREGEGENRGEEGREGERREGKYPSTALT